MSTEGNTRGKGRPPGTKRRRFQEIADAANSLSPDAAASVVEGPEGAEAVSIMVGRDTAAHFKGFAGTWRARVVRVRGDEVIDTGSQLYAAQAVAYTEKNARKVATALLAAVDGQRTTILDHNLMLDVAERVNELRDGSEATVEADSPGAYYVNVKIDEQHRAHFGHDAVWGGSLMRRDEGGGFEFAGRSFTTEVQDTETDSDKIAEAIVAAITDHASED